MKIKHRGVATNIIAIVIIVVVAVAAVAFVLLLRGGGGGPSGLLLYPGSQSWEIPSDTKAAIPASAEFAGYTVSGASVQEILNWYKDQMTGWTLVTEGTHGLLYRKGNDGADIEAGEITGQPVTDYILVTAPWSAFAAMIKS